jgi:hypothetical protein
MNVRNRALFVGRADWPVRTDGTKQKKNATVLSGFIWFSNALLDTEVILFVSHWVMYFRFSFAYTVFMFDPDAHLPRLNRNMVYLGACLIAGIRLAREKQVNVRVIPTSHAIEESVDLAHDIYNRVFRKVPAKLADKRG